MANIIRQEALISLDKTSASKEPSIFTMTSDGLIDSFFLLVDEISSSETKTSLIPDQSDNVLFYIIRRR